MKVYSLVVTLIFASLLSFSVVPREAQAQEGNPETSLPALPQPVSDVENSRLPAAPTTFTNNVIQVSAGRDHTCVLLTSGGVMCWGYNAYGQLGDGTTLNKTIPVNVVGLSSGVVAISSGNMNTCALTSGGAVKCWGANSYGQLGDDTTSDRFTPVNVQGLSSGVMAIGAGGWHTCAQLVSGGVKCWGYNYYGQLGDGTAGTGTDKHAPVSVSGLGSDVTAIVAGGLHTCAIASAGAHCWGSNTHGQLGDGTATNRSAPVDVTGLGSGVTSMATGGYQTCALTTGGGMKCWGNNNYGQLGDGTTTVRYAPVDVVGLSSGVTAVTKGEYHTCALVSGGAAVCWGQNHRGQLGDGTTGNKSVPTGVIGMGSGVMNTSAGGSHTCALSTRGGLKCWGSNSNGQLGNDTTAAKFVPVDVSGLSSGVAAIATGGWQTCALMTGGDVKCWGDNAYGQLGDGTTENRSTPVTVTAVSNDVASLSAGYWHTCALSTGGAAKCWGYNSDGELGDGTTTEKITPVDVIGLSSGVSAISAGYWHTCVITTGGSAKCWGDNDMGQLGNGAPSDYESTPVNVSGLISGVTAIAAGGDHSCVITTGGKAKCWGVNDYGELGNGYTATMSTTVNVSGLSSGVAAIAAGGDHSCALMSSGAVRCWGSNYRGQLGIGNTLNKSSPVTVSRMISGVVAIAAGGEHSCALVTGGTVKCWGYNGYGQLGDGTNINRTTPATVTELGSGVIAISAGADYTCALTADHGVKCWGNNFNGQLGDGTAWQTAPVEVLGFSGGGIRLDTLVMSIHRTVPPAERYKYEEILRHFADAVYEMSNGLHFVSYVTLYQEGQARDRANVIWNAQDTPRAESSGFFVGQQKRIWFGDTLLMGTAMDALLPVNAKAAGYALAHEWGHYYYGLFDESAALEPSGNGESYLPHTEDLAVQDSVMTDAMNATPACTLNPPSLCGYAWLNFSVAKNYSSDHISKTAQYRMYESSGWDTLARDPKLDPCTLWATTRPTRKYFPELAPAQPVAGGNSSIQLPIASGLARSSLAILWIEPTDMRVAQADASFNAYVTAFPTGTLTYPKPVLLAARIQADLPVTGIEITASIESPSGSVAPVQYRDDGVPPDYIANDGEYSAQVSYSESGTHQITTTFAVIAGVSAFTQHGQLPYGSATSALITVTENVLRVVTTTLQVDDVSADDHANITAAATTLAMDNSWTHGKIDQPGDVDMFKVVAELTSTLVIRLRNIGAEIQPRMRVLAVDGVTVLDEPTLYLGSSCPFARIQALAGETFYVLVEDARPAQAAGTYVVSAGPPLPVGPEHVVYTVYMPSVMR